MESIFNFRLYEEIREFLRDDFKMTIYTNYVDFTNSDLHIGIRAKRGYIRISSRIGGISSLNKVFNVHIASMEEFKSLYALEMKRVKRMQA